MIELVGFYEGKGRESGEERERGEREKHKQEEIVVAKKQRWDERNPPATCALSPFFPLFIRPIFFPPVSHAKNKAFFLSFLVSTTFG